MFIKLTIARFTSDTDGYIYDKHERNFNINGIISYDTKIHPVRDNETDEFVNVTWVKVVEEEYVYTGLLAPNETAPYANRTIQVLACLQTPEEIDALIDKAEEKMYKGIAKAFSQEIKLKIMDEVNDTLRQDDADSA